MQAIRLKRQVREQRFEIWEKSANIEKQTSDAQTSDRKPLRLPFRLKELRTFACFPISPQRGINYPPTCVGPPFSPERETCCIFLLISFRMLAFLKKHSASLLQSAKIARSRESVRILADLWALAHTDPRMAMPFLPTANKVRGFTVPLSLQKGAAFCKLSFS